MTTGFADFLFNNPTGGSVRPLLDPVTGAGGSGGFLSNLHNAYVATAVNRAYGKVLVTRVKAPTFPHTRDGAKRMGRGQVRYFSICQNEFVTQRYVACRPDDRSLVDRDGYVTYVMSTKAQRPSRATARCGYTWLPWGPDAEGVLIFRHMLPAADFEQSIHRAVRGHEAATMGPYLPVSRYHADARAFDAAHRCARSRRSG